MKKNTITFFFILASIISYAQSIEKDVLGTWEMGNDPDYTWTFKNDGTLVIDFLGDISKHTYKFTEFDNCKSRFTETEEINIIQTTSEDGDSTCYGISFYKNKSEHNLVVVNVVDGMSTYNLYKYFD